MMADDCGFIHICMYVALLTHLSVMICEGLAVRASLILHMLVFIASSIISASLLMVRSTISTALLMVRSRILLKQNIWYIGSDFPAGVVLWDYNDSLFSCLFNERGEGTI